MAYTSKFKGKEIDELLEKVQLGQVEGNSIPIVDSVDKLDNNAPAGSLAVVAQQGTSDTKKPYDLYQLDIENDCLIDQENYTIEILYPEKLSKVKNVDFNIPSAAIHGENPSILVIGNLSFFNMMSGGGDPSNPDLSNTIGVVIGFTVKNNVVDKVEVIVIIKGETYIFNIMSYVDNKYAINQVDLENLQQVVQTIDEDIYYFFDMYSAMTGSQEKYVDEFVLLNAGTPSKAKLFIKKQEWEDIHEQFNFQPQFDIINARIPTKISQLENDYGYLYDKYYNIQQINSNNITIKNEDLIYLLTVDKDINITIDEESNFYKASIIYHQTFNGINFNINNRNINYKEKPGKYLLEIIKLNQDTIIYNNIYLGIADFAYVKIHNKWNTTNDIKIGTLQGEYLKIYKNGSGYNKHDLENGRWLNVDDVFEIYFKGTFKIHTLVESNITFINFGNKNNSIDFIPGSHNSSYKEDVHTLVTDNDNISDNSVYSVKKITYMEGLEEININNSLYSRTIHYITNIYLPSTAKIINDLYFNNNSYTNTSRNIYLKDIYQLYNLTFDSNKKDYNLYFYQIDKDNIKLIIPDNIKMLNTRYGIPNLTSVVLHEDIKYIDENCFYGLTNIKELYIPSPYYWNPRYINFKYLTNCNIFHYSDDKYGGYLGRDYLQIQDTLYRYKSNVENVVIPKDIKIIGNCSFYDDKIIKTITLHEDIKIIENDAFFGSSIENINSENVEIVFEGSFYDSEIKSFDFDKLKEVKGQAFRFCEANYYNFSKNTIIPLFADYCFANIKDNSKIVVPESLYSEWISTFNNNSKLTNYIDHIVSVNTAVKFTVGNNHYITEHEYTWQQYIESNLCNGPFTISDGVVMSDSVNNVQLNGVNVLATDVIQSLEYSILINEVEESN